MLPPLLLFNLQVETWMDNYYSITPNSTCFQAAWYPLPVAQPGGALNLSTCGPVVNPALTFCPASTPGL